MTGYSPGFESRLESKPVITPVWQDELNTLDAFVVEKRKAGTIPEATEERLLLIFADILYTATDDLDPDLADPSLQGVARHAVLEMRRALLQLHPELSREIRSLGGGPER